MASVDTTRENMTQAERYRIGQILRLLDRNAKLGSATRLDPEETVFMGTVLRDWLADITEKPE